MDDFIKQLKEQEAKTSETEVSCYKSVKPLWWRGASHRQSRWGLSTNTVGIIVYRCKIVKTVVDYLPTRQVFNERF